MIENSEDTNNYIDMNTPNILPQILSRHSRDDYRKEVELWLKNINSDLATFNHLIASVQWQLYTQFNDTLSKTAITLYNAKNNWRSNICDTNLNLELLTYSQMRQFYLLCRGARFTTETSRAYMHINNELSEIYNSKVCFPGEVNIPLPDNKCVHGEPDLEKLMRRNDLSAEQLKIIWKSWHNHVGPRIKKLYPYAIDLQNAAARKTGYKNMAQVWKEELEIANIEALVSRFYEEVKPLYILLHAVVRNKLHQLYGPQKINPFGPIPIHLLGNMWGQDWSSLLHLFFPSVEDIDINKNLQKKNWSVVDMVSQAEDMFMSLGFPKMTSKFWKYSIFQNCVNLSMWHSTAVNLFSKDDYRIILCAEKNIHDFYTIHHEIGHIQYYMAYKNQTTLFQNGATSAFHESIGDAVMHGVMTVQHLFRLGLVSDNDIKRKEELDLYILLLQALKKIPQIPYAFLLDNYRWSIFEGKVTPDIYNRMYWRLTNIIRGIKAPEYRGEEYFDAAGKFHVAYNIPYIQYFLSEVLQVEIFQALCGSFALQNYTQQPLGRLFNCDIYGAKKAGLKLIEFLKKGSSQHWSSTLELLTGKTYISTKALLNYYEPLYKWLQEYVVKHGIFVGW